MASFKTLTPTNVNELHENLVKLHENRGHVKSIAVDSIDQMVKIDLDTLANFKVPDFQIPIKSSSLTEARETVQQLWGDSANGHAPTLGQAERLFHCIDNSRH